MRERRIISIIKSRRYPVDKLAEADIKTLGAFTSVLGPETVSDLAAAMSHAAESDRNKQIETYVADQPFRRMRPGRVSSLRTRLSALADSNQVPEGVDLAAVQDALREKEQALTEREDAKERKRVMSKDVVVRRRLPLVAASFSLASLALNIGGYIDEHVPEGVNPVQAGYHQVQEYLRTMNERLGDEHQLTETESKRTYTGWRTSAVSPDQQYVPVGSSQPIAKHQSIVLTENGKPFDTGIEPRPYTTTSGQTGIELWQPTEDPYMPLQIIFGRNARTRLRDRNAYPQVRRILEPSGVIKLSGLDGAVENVKVEDATPKDPKDYTFVATQVQPVTK